MEEDFDSTLKKLNDQVSQFTKTKLSQQKNNNFSSFQGSMLNKFAFAPKINFSSPVIRYAAVPVAIFVVLLIIKPGFIKEEVIDDSGMTEEKIQIKKLLIATVVITSILGFLLLLNSYRTNVT